MKRTDVRNALQVVQTLVDNAQQEGRKAGLEEAAQVLDRIARRWNMPEPPRGALTLQLELGDAATEIRSRISGMKA